MGAADFHAVVEGTDQILDSLVIDMSGPGTTAEDTLLCFLVLAPEVTLAGIEPGLRKHLRTELSPRHVPDRFIVVDAIPRTLSGKKCEVPIKRILTGTPVDQAIGRDALSNPESLAPYIELATASSTRGAGAV